MTIRTNKMTKIITNSYSA